MAAEEGRDVYFLCYEKPGDFCHRYLLANFLMENGIECRENPADRQAYAEGRVRLVDEPVRPSPSPSDGITYSVSEGGYAQRTRENAVAEDVDFTFAFAVDFGTAGERCTARAAGDSLIAVDLPMKKGGGLDLSASAVKKAVDTLAAALPDEFLGGEPFGVNVAGNGMTTLSEHGVTQDQCDVFLTKVFESLRKRGAVVSSVRSGGQTGVDEAGVCAASVLGIPVHVHAPKGWMMRGADGLDRSDEGAFRARFAAKDAARIRKEAGVGAARKQKSNIKNSI